MSTVLLVEPYCGGSHQQFIETLTQRLFAPEDRFYCESGQLYSEQRGKDDAADAQPVELPAESSGRSAPRVCVATLTARKWKWRLQTSALALADCIPEQAEFDVVLVSSMTNLAELCALRSNVAKARVKLVYFHENQMVYPTQQQTDGNKDARKDDRDLALPWIQVISALVADRCVFNSEWNMRSFIDGVPQILRQMPKEQRPCNVQERLRARSEVIYFPIVLPPRISTEFNGSTEGDNDADFQDSAALPVKPIHILWNHRWEYDKRPDLFFDALRQLHASGVAFSVSVIGQQFAEIPAVFSEAQRDTALATHFQHFGYLASQNEYWAVLDAADIVVSTTDHEFLGVSVIEAASRRCFPLCPKRLSFPEYLPETCLYDTQPQLVKRLRYYCRYPTKLRNWKWWEQFDIQNRFAWDAIGSQYANLLCLSD